MHPMRSLQWPTSSLILGNASCDIHCSTGRYSVQFIFLRLGCSQAWFTDLDHPRRTIADWQETDNHDHCLGVRQHLVEDTRYHPPDLNRSQSTPVKRQLASQPLDRLARRTIGSGDRIRTYDLRVMSPTSYRTAPPRGLVSSRDHNKPRPDRKVMMENISRSWSQPPDQGEPLREALLTRLRCAAQGRAQLVRSSLQLGRQLVMRRNPGI